jgi:hypothetical protein
MKHVLYFTIATWIERKGLNTNEIQMKSYVSDETDYPLELIVSGRLFENLCPTSRQHILSDHSK